MKKMTLTNAIVGVLVGIGIILLACLVPLSELLHWILIIFGAITVVINAVNLFNKYDNYCFSGWYYLRCMYDSVPRNNNEYHHSILLNSSSIT